MQKENSHGEFNWSELRKQTNKQDCLWIRMSTICPFSFVSVYLYNSDEDFSGYSSPRAGTLFQKENSNFPPMVLITT